MNYFFGIIVLKYITKKLIISINFILKFFFEENTYKFCYKKNLQEIATNFLAKYFV